MEHWPVDRDYDWTGLPQDPGPEPWVRTWEWLAAVRDQRDATAFREYLAELADHDMQPEFGFRPLSSPSLTRLPLPQELVLEEFASQSLIFQHAGRHYRLAASRVPAHGAGPLQSPVGFVSLTGPAGRRVDSVAGPVGALDARSRWSDLMVAVTPARARQYAREWQQPMFLVWRPGAGHGLLEVVDPQDGAVLAGACARVTRALRTCPMIRCAVPGQLCRVYGGPWVSRAILASSRWQRERQRRLADVGCDTCGDGRVRVGPTNSGVATLLGAYSGGGPSADDPGPTRYTEVLVRRPVRSADSGD